jgi:tetratricopeptide (TPR) repeat protein
MARHGWLIVVWLCAGAGPPPVKETAAPASPAVAAWYQGRQALEDNRLDEAIGQFQLSLRLDPHLVQNHLSLAAAHLAQGDDARAVPHLERYLAARPSHLVVRCHLAELLFKLNRAEEARAEFERLAADVQDDPAQAREHRLHCHSRLMQIAEAEGDVYGEHLHRGIGLYLLGSERARLAADGGQAAEGLLFRAAAELTLAGRERPEEARPCWYLHEVWSRLARRQPALRWLRAAETAAPFSPLTAAERRGLHLACQRLLAEARPK